MISLQRTVLVWLFFFSVCFRSAESVSQGPQETILLSKIAKTFPDFVVKSIIDVGANHGRWSRDVRKIFPEAFILMIEATPTLLPDLTEMQNQIGNAETHIAVLSNAPNQTVSFYQNQEGDTGNSMFQEKTKYYANIKPVERITSTIDLEISASSIDVSSVSILKLDIQGAEVLALLGATQTLQAATFVTLEASVVDYNAGGACLFEIDQVLRDAGFYIYDFGDLAYNKHLFKSPGLGQFDVLYVKPSSPHLPKALHRSSFCGMDRGNDKSLSTLDTIDSELEALVSKANRRAGVFFFIGVLVGSVGMLAVLMVAIYIRKRSLPRLPVGRRLR